MKDIELQFIKISKINGSKSKGYIALNNEIWDILKLPGWKKKIRLSYLMSHVIKNKNLLFFDIYTKSNSEFKTR